MAANTRLIKDLYFVNIYSDADKRNIKQIHRRLSCSKCFKVFHTAFGLLRHSQSTHFSYPTTLTLNHEVNVRARTRHLRIRQPRRAKGARVVVLLDDDDSSDDNCSVIWDQEAEAPQAKAVEEEPDTITDEPELSEPDEPKCPLPSNSPSNSKQDDDPLDDEPALKLDELIVPLVDFVKEGFVPALAMEHGVQINLELAAKVEKDRKEIFNQTTEEESSESDVSFEILDEIKPKSRWIDSGKTLILGEIKQESPDQSQEWRRGAELCDKLEMTARSSHHQLEQVSSSSPESKSVMPTEEVDMANNILEDSDEDDCDVICFRSEESGRTEEEPLVPSTNNILNDHISTPEKSSKYGNIIELD